MQRSQDAKRSWSTLHSNVTRILIIGICALLTACALITACAPVTVGPTAEAPASERAVADQALGAGAQPTHTATAVTAAVAKAPQPDVTSVEPTAVPPPAATRSYTVQSGDTLLGIAMTFDVPIAAVQLQNDLGEATMIQVDQVLEIPPSGAWETASPFWVVHEVVAGETLSALAARYGLSVGELASLNGFADANVLGVGQRLILPLDAPKELVAGANQSSAPLPTETLVPTEAALAQAPDPPATPDVAAADVLAATTVVEDDAQAAEPTPVPPAAAPPAAPALPNPATPADVAALPGVIFRLLNEQRAAHGLPPLLWNETLARAAQRHANDCAARGWCGHTGSDGSRYKERIIREGYNPVRWSECWAWYGTPELAVAMWMDEVPPNDPHRRTILSDYLTEVGVGVVPGNGHGYYFIADFGTPAE